MKDADNLTSNPTVSQGAVTIGALIERRLTRRGFMGGMLATAGAALTGCVSPQAGQPSAFRFTEIARGIDEFHHVPPECTADVLVRWGDHLFDAQARAFDPMAQTETSQLQRFGYNNDFIGFVPLSTDTGEVTRGLLCVNHEYTSTLLMFPGIAGDFPRSFTRNHCLVEMAATGGSVVEVAKTDSQWRMVQGSRYNRRITAHKTPMQMTGPVAGHERLKTTDDPTGTLVAGTMNNCAGGITPWGTWLMAEENFNLYFLGEVPEDHPEAANHRRYGVPATRFAWGMHVDRFNLEVEPQEPNRFGWIVEVDPRNPDAVPKKRSALGRFKHEGAETVIAPDGRVVIYMGDDQRYDYVYKFVTDKAFSATSPDPDLLDHGTLYVARFDEDGTVTWLPLRFGTGPLTSANGFQSQADVLIETRRAADLLGATPMDRPEDVEPDPASGRVYVMLTNNHWRSVDQVNAANPRANNHAGHIIEIIEPGGDFAATSSRWDFLVRCGDPGNPADASTWNAATSDNGWFTCPDNAAVDPAGRLWVATDGNEDSGGADGLWAVETEGPRRGTGRAFFRAPVGAEVCGPRFTSDGRNLFLAVQHPGDGDDATFEAPTSRWPDFQANMPPRPSVVVIRRKDGGIVG